MSTNYNNNESVYNAPAADLGNLEQHDLIDKNAFFVVSRTKLIILSFCTLNLYLIYWFYRNWKLQKDNADFDCTPIVRAIFNIFFTHSLFAQVNDALQSKGIACRASGLMATFYVITIIVSALTNRWEPSVDQLALYVVFFLATIALILLPIWYVQDRINQVCDDPQGAQNAALTLTNWIFILLGLIYWGFVFMGIFISFIG
ncbi:MULTISPECIES: hypothetical protein [Aliiglaciecola]|uniref:hypothetical protein n=1 Tax=Aliiglaciecola TaxID=1406885 RepID=UPI001C09AC82|nr:MULTISPECIES: hypothetical protein [Aliiglaciecola]MBU2876047.1 hypothetical protein [Aliiglaciecola lipolytica]MDO6713131.1 hypothetical protein [Aliiglaciecola sp. 2_MG-2023]MDO6754195.1 hypothetical protein [Aliiglaciecola sp. 1_MG-2023]